MDTAEILLDFYKLTLDCRDSSYQRNTQAPKLREKNLNVLKHFLNSVEVLLDPAAKRQYTLITERYFNVLVGVQIDESEVKICIKDIMYYLRKLEGDILFTRFHSMLTEYKKS